MVRLNKKRIGGVRQPGRLKPACNVSRAQGESSGRRWGTGHRVRKGEGSLGRTRNMKSYCCECDNTWMGSMRSTSVVRKDVRSNGEDDEHRQAVEHGRGHRQQRARLSLSYAASVGGLCEATHPLRLGRSQAGELLLGGFGAAAEALTERGDADGHAHGECHASDGQQRALHEHAGSHGDQLKRPRSPTLRCGPDDVPRELGLRGESIG
eukprot:1195406-Prorocentrum_minimum.AAC.7